MADLLRTGAPLDYHELVDLALDGLLHRIAPDCWVAVGTRVDAHVRAQALGPAPVNRLVLSHRSAYWVWWGQGLGPVTPEYTTARRRRLRGAQLACTVHEKNLDPSEIALLSGIAVTTRERTLRDVLMTTVDRVLADLRAETGAPVARVAPEDLPEAALTEARAVLLTLPEEHRQDFGEYIAGAYRLPGLMTLRALVDRALRGL
ncbi:hypothetical protein [Brevibacterium samyangense]|uniref:Transcriptional regulator n=1 Tax=Brevibacterium samyangense TaxID=366888 RepID=A0ABP5EUX3_9MICO